MSLWHEVLLTFSKGSEVKLKCHTIPVRAARLEWAPSCKIFLHSRRGQVKIKLWRFQSSEVGLFAALHATQRLISSGQGGISKMKVAYVYQNMKEVLDALAWRESCHNESPTQTYLTFRGSSARSSAAASSRRPPRPATTWRKLRRLPRWRRDRSSSDKSSL